ncbi:MAG: DUF305 domain-containing protein [Propionicimonas sp.]|nr:DUF305 domain-containing protein [Propionicimonas sp.]
MTDFQQRRNALPWVAVAIIGILALGGAFLLGRFAVPGSDSPAPLSSSADAGFARDMQLHHAQAVEMAMDIYPRTTDPEVRALAYDIATGQSAQRGQMYQWLVDWGLPQAGGPIMAWMDGSNAHAGHGTGTALTTEQAYAAMGMASRAELDALREATGTTADCQFLDLMTRHHQGAIEMVDAVLELGAQPDVLHVAQSMSETQNAEIDAMASIQDRVGCSQ